VPYDRVAVVFAALVVAAVAVFVVRFLARLPVATRDLMRPSLPRGVQA
jgi:cytochrome c oxidase subunit 1